MLKQPLVLHLEGREVRPALLGFSLFLFLFYLLMGAFIEVAVVLHKRLALVMLLLLNLLSLMSQERLFSIFHLTLTTAF